MLTFGTIAEGPTDQTVIENILHGYFATPEDEPVVNPVQPPRPLTETPGGWGHVIQCLKKREYDGALQWNDYLVIHIDADRQDEYDVPRFDAGRELTIPERVERIIQRLKREIDEAFYQAHAGRMLFAITVDSIECWLFLCSTMTTKQRRPLGALTPQTARLPRLIDLSLPSPVKLA